MRRAARQFAFYALLVGIWALIARLHIWPPYIVPPPMDVYDALRDGFKDHSLLIAIAVSSRHMLLGYGISVILGMFLGIALAANQYLEQTVGGLLVSLQSMPSICWLPLAVLWFGLSENAILFVIVMGSTLSVTISMETGRKQMPKIYSMAGRNLGARKWKLFYHVLLPASMPYIITGLKQGWAFAWRSLFAGEMLSLSLGLGQRLNAGRDNNDMPQVIAVMILIIAIGYIVDGWLFRSIERRLQHKWGLLPST
jgi:NitT/TauT family transport system permease protein